MRSGNNHSNKWLYPFITAVLFALAGMYLLRFFRYWINPDATSYISITEKYLRGDISHAINGLWAPLLSWLLIPFIAFNVPPALGAKILSLCIGVFSLVSIYHLSRRFEISGLLRLLSMIFLLPALLFFSLYDFTPDLLMASFLALYLYVLLDRDYPRTTRQGAACGIFAALAYLSKAYALPFFMVHFALCNALAFIGSGYHKRRLILRSCLLGYAVCLAISGIWIGRISGKYGRFTINTAGEFNFRQLGLSATDRPQAAIHERFLVPPNETATHAWEDPTYIPLNPWSPLQSARVFKHELVMVRTAVLQSISAYNWFSVFSIAVMAGVFVLLCMQSGKNLIAQRTDLFAMLAIGIYNLGFLPLGLVLERYILLCAFLLVLLGAQLLEVVQRSKCCTGIRKVALIALFFISFALMPGRALVRYAGMGKATYLKSVQLTGECHVQGNIASNGNYLDMLQIAFWTGSRYFGVLSDTLSQSQILDTLRTYNIKYYFVWDPPDKGPHLRNCAELTLAGTPDVRIYAPEGADSHTP